MTEGEPVDGDPGDGAGREGVPRRYLEAGFKAYQSGDRPEADRLWRAGLAQGETFLADGERHPGVRELVLQLHGNAGAGQHNSGQVSATNRHCLLLLGASSWWGIVPRHPGVRGEVLILSRASAAWLESEWPAFVDRWLLGYQGPAETIPDPRAIHDLPRQHRAWWLDRQSTENGPTRARIEAALGLLERLDALGHQRDTLHQSVDALAGSLGLADAAAGRGSVTDRLRTLPWTTRLRRFRTLRRLRSVLAEIGATEAPVAGLREEAGRERRRQAEWLGEAVGRHMGLPGELDDLAGVELAAAGACFGGAPPERRANLAAVLRALRAPGGKHLLMHASYLPDNPWASYFQVRRRGGAAAAPLLLRAAADPIGLASSLLAGGARSVIGALWPCHQAASALFCRCLYARAAESPGTPWYRLLHEGPAHHQRGGPGAAARGRGQGFHRAHADRGPRPEPALVLGGVRGPGRRRTAGGRPVAGVTGGLGPGRPRHGAPLRPPGAGPRRAAGSGAGAGAGCRPSASRAGCGRSSRVPGLASDRGRGAARAARPARGSRP